MTEQTRTYDLWLVTVPPGDNSWLVDTPEAAEHHEARGLGVQPVELTLRVGQSVNVRAYGRVRRGNVMKLGPRRPVVAFQRNAQREIGQRAFPPSEILYPLPNPRRG